MGFSQPGQIFVCTKWGLSGDLYLSPRTPCCGSNETAKEELDGKRQRERRTRKRGVVCRETSWKIDGQKNDARPWEQKETTERKKNKGWRSCWIRNRKGTIVQTKQGFLLLTGHIEYICVCVFCHIDLIEVLPVLLDYSIKCPGPFPLLSGKMVTINNHIATGFVRRNEKTTHQVCKTFYFRSHLTVKKMCKHNQKRADEWDIQNTLFHQQRNRVCNKHTKNEGVKFWKEQKEKSKSEKLSELLEVKRSQMFSRLNRP